MGILCRRERLSGKAEGDRSQENSMWGLTEK